VILFFFLSLIFFYNDCANFNLKLVQPLFSPN